MSSMIEDPIYRHLAELLHTVWGRVKWSNISTSWKRRQTDVFQHRLKKASQSKNINQVVERLCKGLSIQSIEPGTPLFVRLQTEEHRTLEVVRKESVVASFLAKSGPGPIDVLRRKLQIELEQKLAEMEESNPHRREIEAKLANLARIEQEITETTIGA